MARASSTTKHKSTPKPTNDTEPKECASALLLPDAAPRPPLIITEIESSPAPPLLAGVIEAILKHKRKVCVPSLATTLP